MNLAQTWVVEPSRLIGMEWQHGQDGWRLAGEVLLRAGGRFSLGDTMGSEHKFISMGLHHSAVRLCHVDCGHNLSCREQLAHVSKVLDHSAKPKLIWHPLGITPLECMRWRYWFVGLHLSVMESLDVGWRRQQQRVRLALGILDLGRAWRYRMAGVLPDNYLMIYQDDWGVCLLAYAGDYLLGFVNGAGIGGRVDIMAAELVDLWREFAADLGVWRPQIVLAVVSPIAALSQALRELSWVGPVEVIERVSCRTGALLLGRGLVEGLVGDG